MIKKVRVLFFASLVGVASSIFAKVDEQLFWKSYPVHLTGQEKSARDVQRAIYNQSPLEQWFPDASKHHNGRDGEAKVVGLTHAAPKFTFSSRPQKDGICRLENYAVIDTTAIYLPALVEDKPLPQMVRSWFSKEYAGIKKHEMTHHAYNQQYLQKMDQYLLKMPYDSSCDALMQTIKGYNSRLIDYTETLHKNFDEAEYKYHVALRDYEARLEFNSETERLKKEAVEEVDKSTQNTKDSKSFKANGRSELKGEASLSRSPFGTKVFLVLLLLGGVLICAGLRYLWLEYKKNAKAPY